MTATARAALLAACAVVTATLALVPNPSESPLGRVASVDGDGPEPRYDAKIDSAALRRAAEVVPGGATYAVVAPDASPLLQGNLKAAAQLFLAPALPVQSVTRADWVVAYGPVRVPGGAEAQPLGGGLSLVRRTR